MTRSALWLCLALAACGIAPLLHEDAVGKVHPGMTPTQVEQTLGVQSYRQAKHGNGTSSWTYKYRETNIAKLLHVTFGPDGRVVRTETEWDPDVYSKKP
jgi:outer membrane protein assembly factor BamE (lipoprotein component of BamABCDE complex)